MSTGDKKGWLARLKEGLGRSSQALTGGLTGLFTGRRKLDDATLEDLEDILIMADFGVPTAARIVSKLSADRYDKDIAPEEVRALIAEVITETLTPVAQPLQIDSSNRPHVLLMVGVNGSGKTTTIGKLARQFKQEGKSVMLAAGDTFRAAAVEQLTIWGDRNKVPVIHKEAGSDAASVAFEALQAARDQNVDVLMIDTAGRLQNKTHLMEELTKMIRVIEKFDETAPHDTLLVLDATTGQNALNQVDVFQSAANISGLIMTKLDGTARGGVLIACADRFGLPVHAIGVGESIDDLQPFNARDFARSIAGIE
ncbi:MAG: signal recognition particle-docking protein FtsY [Alphaproteobacteria bacterium]|nr:MAG: signal recognition particle-docking protein FtsY [Alphaproteobacteria bacterium]